VLRLSSIFPHLTYQMAKVHSNYDWIVILSDYINLVSTKFEWKTRINYSTGLSLKVVLRNV